MRSYETTFVMTPTLDTEGFQAELEKVKELIGSHGGSITAEKEWGRRRLAYPIQGHAEGIYHILRFDGEPDCLPELDRWYKLNENVLRAIVIIDEGCSLDHVGQVSESDERGHRDSRDRRGDRHGPRDGDRRPPSGPPASAPVSAPASAATSESAPEKTDEAPADAVAATETAAPETGGEESSE